jgi:hypothetical protein
MTSRLPRLWGDDGGLIYRKRGTGIRAARSYNMETYTRPFTAADQERWTHIIEAVQRGKAAAFLYAWRFGPQPPDKDDDTDDSVHPPRPED